MSIARRCPECEHTFPLADFPPRDLRQYDQEDVPASDQILRESRCPRCNHVYGRRRRFVLRPLSRLAKSLGVRIRAKKRSVFRIVEVVSRRVPANLVERLNECVRAFNESLPDDRCEIARHGVCVVTVGAPVRSPRPRQKTLFKRT